MATFGEIQTAVSKRLQDANNVAVALSDVAASINDAIRYWKFRRFYFNEVFGTITLTAQDPSFVIPSTFLVNAVKDGGFHIQYSEARYPLTKIEMTEYDNAFMENGFGMPRVYAKMADTGYKCYPIPDRDYVVGMHYLKDYVDLVNTSDTNDFTNNASRLITLWTTGNIVGEFRQDEKMEGYFRSAAENEYNNLLMLTNKMNATGKLKINNL